MRERNKAIREAWEREKELVSQGKGTRDWTEEQQRDILDPNKGKAYDTNGRAFEGQHMKSAAEYPKYQGDPDNIQFLTREEHLAAHKGNWQNPTNWYYNPEAKSEAEKFVYFGEDELIPCKIISLSNPIMSPIIEAQESNNEPQESPKAEETSTKRSYPSNEEETPHHQESTSHKSTASKSTSQADEALGGNGIKMKPHFHNINKVWKVIKSGAKKTAALCIKHPEIPAGIAFAVKKLGPALIDAISEQATNKNSNNISNINLPLEINNLDDNPFPANGENLDAVENSENEAADNYDDSSISMDCPEKRPYTPNDVPEGEQRYHYKDGVRLGKRVAYHREGKQNDS